MNTVSITTFYRFLPLSEEQLQSIKPHLETVALGHGVRGLCLLGKEGINATISGPAFGVGVFKREVQESLHCQDLAFKDSQAEKHPFQVFKVKIKDEIVSLGKPELKPSRSLNNHLTPDEWHQVMQDPETLVLDTRNDYEVEIGKFKRATEFTLKEFNEFPQKLRNSGIDKNKRVLIYCTGGIRCEKAILEMNEQGYQDVYQLNGGILNYLKEYPNQDFEGECFVFDYRVALDQKLAPTRQYSLCPHCGQPAQQPITCIKCGRNETICHRCETAGIQSCSKNCAHHETIGSDSQKIHIPELKKRNRI